ncbi:MAG: GAF domain-containing protein [Chloroflexi bacterium]|nr:GAF domain-containing protein [Chloroflexota bacterium]
MPITLSAKTDMRDHRWKIRAGSIRARLLIGFVLMALLSAIGISAGSVIVGYVNGSQQVQERLDSVAALKALAIRNWVSTLQNGLLEAVNDQSADARISIVLDLARAHQYYEWYNEAVRLRLRILIQQSQQFEELCLVDANGVVVLCTGSRQIVESLRDGSQNCQDEAFFQRGLAGPYVELPFEPPAQKSGRQNNPNSALCHFKSTAPESSFVIAARPVIGSQGEVLGVIAGRTGGRELTRILTDPTGLGGAGKAYLVDALFARLPNNTVSPASNRDTTKSPHSTGVEAALQSQSQVSGIYADYQGDQVFGVYRWLPDLQVVLAVEQNFSDALGAIFLNLAVNLAIALVVVLLAVGASFRITRSITQPLVGLVETASEIAAGDLERTAPVQRDDEIGVLATAFNSMTAQLRDLINHLEERVHERTQALRAANEALQQRAVQMETSAQVSRQITSILSIGDLLARVVQLIQDAFGYFDARIFLLEGEELVLRVTAKSGHPGVTRLRLSQTSLNTEAVHTNQAVVVNDVSQDARYLMDEYLTDTESAFSIRSELVIPLRVGERIIGTLDVVSDKLNTFTPEDLLVIQSLGDQVAIAIENARLYEHSRELAVLEGRNQLARDLHDSVNQSLYSLNLLSEGWRRLVRSGEAANVEEYFDRAAEISQQALGEMRLLLYELRPTTFEQGGLVGALQRRLDAVERRAGIQARLIADDLIDLATPVQDGLYHIAQEALNNVLKHAGATQVIVRLSAEGDNQVVLKVSDNGRSFALDSPNSQGGMGLNNMRQRAQEMGGTLVIESGPGKGTTVTATLDYATVAASGSDSL